MTGTGGRRERKKAQTRQALNDAALRLFSEKGYDNVGVREVAQAADVALSTLFKHYPTKEALVFDEDADIEAGLVAAVRDRAPGQSVLHALRDHLIATRTKPHGDNPLHAVHVALVESTPALQDYARRMWLRHEGALAAVIAQATGLDADDPTVTGLARFAMEAPGLARTADDPPATMRALFDLLEHGWADTPAARTPETHP
ncbi:TetR/AcrR family transcriptional regulator [Streptomyces sp. LZ34]